MHAINARQKIGGGGSSIAGVNPITLTVRRTNSISFLKSIGRDCGFYRVCVNSSITKAGNFKTHSEVFLGGFIEILVKREINEIIVLRSVFYGN